MDTTVPSLSICPCCTGLSYHTPGRTRLHSICRGDVIAPPPQIQLSTKPSSLVLQSGQTKHIEVFANSSTDLDSFVSFTLDNKTGLTSKFTATEISLSPHGVASSDLQISGNSSSVIGYTIPIVAHVTFPATLTSNLITSRISAPNWASLTLHAYPFVTVIPPKQLGEQITDIFNVFSFTIHNIGGILTYLGAIAGSVVTLLTILNGTRKNKEQVSGSRGAPF
jgi:hypothetical protein